ncbi:MULTISPECIES: BBE domain-containing protein [Streptomyces violaceusniger group]|uniref:Berberine/berberine-like domain-containing protein n=1 Tax=Streptomyces rhizosphaericus TaxID=114699 RepID=A0ABP4CLY7_9ACTN|nr:MULTISPECIES: BBE domain-containing protein [Streptomyces violaceusniger group]
MAPRVLPRPFRRYASSALLPELPGSTLKDWRRAYYGANYDRLVRVNRNYDPTNFFSYPQAIGT